MAKARIDALLAARGLFASRAKAREAIAAGLVRVDGEVIVKPSSLVDAAAAAIEASAPYPWVSRGGVKLAAALDAFAIDPKGAVCLDVGASTGGFTHVLLTRGAARVFAVDVGSDQLHASLREEPRMTRLEGTDARMLTEAHLRPPPDLVVADVSFISLTKALPRALALAAAQARLVALIKPQFEAGRSATRKGIVRDAAVRRAACEGVASFLRQAGWIPIGLIESPIAGGDGNLEFLIRADKSAGAD